MNVNLNINRLKISVAVAMMVAGMHAGADSLSNVPGETVQTYQTGDAKQSSARQSGVKVDTRVAAPQAVHSISSGSTVATGRPRLPANIIVPSSKRPQHTTESHVAVTQHTESTTPQAFRAPGSSAVFNSFGGDNEVRPVQVREYPQATRRTRVLTNDVTQTYQQDAPLNRFAPAGASAAGQPYGQDVENREVAVQRIPDQPVIPVQVQPVQVQPVQVQPVQAQPVQVTPVQVTPVQVNPVRVAPVQVAPVRAAPR